MKTLRSVSLISAAVAALSGVIGCAGSADEGIPTASWISVPNDGTRAPRPATVEVEKDRAGLSQDDVVSEDVAATPYDRFSARGNEPGTKVPPPRRPYEPPPVSPSEKPQEPSTPSTVQPPNRTPGSPPLTSLESSDGRYVGPASVYPTPAQRAQGAGSVSVYPPAGLTFNPQFARTPTFYPVSPTARSAGSRP